MWIESGEKMWSRKSSGWKKELSIGLETNEKMPREQWNIDDSQIERQRDRENGRADRKNEYIVAWCSV